MVRHYVLTCVTLLVLVPARVAWCEDTQNAPNPTSADEIKKTMRGLLGDIRTLMDGSLREQWFVPPGDVDAIEAALANIESRSFALAAHAPQMDMEFLTAVLDRYAWWLRIAYRQDDREAFDEILSETLDTCITCHTRLPSSQDSPTAEAFIASDVVSKLPPPKKLSLLIATRRFDDALDLLETTFAKPFAQWPPAHATLRSYIVTTVRVKRDFDRAAGVLEGLAARDDVPANVRLLTEVWASDLRRESGPTTDGEETKRLASARARVERAENDPRNETELLVQYAAASAILHDYVTTPNLSAAARSEAAYLLGLCYHRMGANESLPQSDFYFEYSVLTDPSGGWAQDAFSLLEMNVVKSYTDAGSQVPEYVEMLLNDLERLLPR